MRACMRVCVCVHMRMRAHACARQHGREYALGAGTCKHLACAPDNKLSA